MTGLAVMLWVVALCVALAASGIAALFITATVQTLMRALRNRQRRKRAEQTNIDRTRKGR